MVDFYFRAGSVPSVPVSVGIFNGSGVQQTIAGITAVYVTTWPAITPNAGLPLPGSSPVTNRAAGTYSTGSDGFTYLSWLPVAADVAVAGDYVALWEVDQGSAKDFWPDPIWTRIRVSPSTS